MIAPASKFAFAGLVLSQTAHSIEEYIGRLWEVWPPARVVSGLVSSDLETGFIIINTSLFAFGFFCLFAFVMPARRGAGAIIAFWIVLELMNTVFHSIWSLTQQAYTPGFATAPFLGLFAVALLISRTRQRA